MGLEAASAGLAAALRVVESGDRTTPSQALDLYRQSDEAANARMSEWTKLKSTQVVQLNDALQKVGIKTIQVSRTERESETAMSQ
jgi:hypothetical protein